MTGIKSRRTSNHGCARRQYIAVIGGAAVTTHLREGARPQRRGGQPWRLADRRRAQGEPPTCDGRRWSGLDFDLRIGETPMNVTGSPAIAFTVNGSLPAPTLRWKEGDTVTLRVANTRTGRLDPLAWSATPRQYGRRPRLEFSRHSFRARPTCTGSRCDKGGTKRYAALGFRSSAACTGRSSSTLQPARFTYDREYVVMLTDWTDERPSENVFAKLKKQSDYYNFRRRTLKDSVRDVCTEGVGAHDGRSQQVGPDADEPHGPRGCLRVHLYISDEWCGAGRQLDGALHPRRTRAPPHHQRVRDVQISMCGFPA